MERCRHTIPALVPLALIVALTAGRADPPADLPVAATAALSARCVACHGGERPAAGLDLSRAATVKAQARRIARAVGEGRMPPDAKIDTHEKAALIALAPATKTTTPRPWSFAPLKRPAAPAAPVDRAGLNPIDRFIRVELAKNGLAPNLPADRHTLLRRVTIDLTGLPPTPQDRAVFLSDKLPGAYERVVERLLASPAYGERWARHWLDVVRFGESNGYERNLLRESAWPYRDWVVDALNADLPFAQFVTDQLAGDVTGALAATGFLVAGCHDDVPSPLEELTRTQRASDLDDIVSTVGEAFLGLTVGCARCHDHKFDPVTQTDYYRLCATVAGVRHGERPLVPAHRVPADRGGANVDPAATPEARLQERLSTVRQLAASAPEYGPDALGTQVRFAPVRARFIRLTILATSDGAEPCLDELAAYGPLDPAINFALGGTPGASSLLPGYPIHQVAHLCDGKLGNAFSWISNERGTGWAQIELPTPTTVDRVVWGRDATGRFKDRLPSRWAISVSEDGARWTEVARRGDVASTVPRPPALAQQLEAAVAAAQAETRESLAYIGVFDDPHPVYLLQRGDVMQRGAEQSPGGVAALEGAFLGVDSKSDDPQRRLALARWIVDKRNPLVWRVFANRLWQGHFGAGLVTTPSDFGNNGQRPSHAALLDWLAAELRDTGSAKRLHRLIVTSATYRQSATNTTAGLKRDAGNRLLWRGPLRRLEAEALWDGVLSVAGTLDSRRGGQPYRLFSYRQENIAFYGPAPNYGPATWRRGIYRMAVRAVRDPLLAGLDCPESATRSPARASTVTPLQAMSLLGGAFVREQAMHFAQRVRREVGDEPARQLDHAWRLALGRSPDPDERRLAHALLTADGLAALCRALINTNEFLHY